MNAIYAQARFRLRAVSSEKLDCGYADGTLPKAQQYLTAIFKTLHLGKIQTILKYSENDKTNSCSVKICFSAFLIMHKLHARIVKDCIFLYYTVDAGMVELVDTRDLKSLDGKMSCRSDSGSRQKAS